MASPHVAGVAALVFAKELITNDEVRAKIESTSDATTGFNPTIYRLNAYTAVH
jgi:subtilisin family serine protease